MKLEKQLGFTMIEVIIAIALLTLLLGLGLFFNFGFYQSYSFDSERNTVVSILEKARSQSLDNINQEEHGVYFGGTDYVLFEGASPLSYATRDVSKDLTIKSTSSVTHNSAVFTQIMFKQLSGQTSAAGSLVLTDRTHTATISFNNEGQINW